MPADHTEKAFENAIEHHLLNEAGYAKADPAKELRILAQMWVRKLEQSGSPVVSL